MALKPGALINLDNGHYVLVVVEKSSSAHVEPGAITLVYLSSNDTGWQVDHRYPEFIWSGNSGEPADALSLVISARGPILVVSREYVGQGQHSTYSWLIQLSSAKPTFLGTLPVAGMLEKGACQSCLLYDYRSNLDAAHSASATISAHYIGWKETARGKEEPVDEIVDYAPNGDGLKAVRGTDLPR